MPLNGTRHPASFALREVLALHTIQAFGGILTEELGRSAIFAIERAPRLGRRWLLDELSARIESKHESKGKSSASSRPKPILTKALRKVLAEELALGRLTALERAPFCGCRTFFEALEALVREHRRNLNPAAAASRNALPNCSLVRSARQILRVLEKPDPESRALLSIAQVQWLFIQDVLEDSLGVLIQTAEKIAAEEPRRRRGQRGSTRDTAELRIFLKSIGFLYSYYYAEGTPSAAEVRKGLRRLVILAMFEGYPQEAPHSAGPDSIYRLARQEFRALQQYM